MARVTKSDAGQERRALIVDDEADILELLELTLLRMGVEAHRASSVSEARARLKENTYQLCLTDMRLPDGEGLDIVRHIGANHPGLPVAVITAYGSADNAVAAMKAGAFDYVPKPLSLEQLRNLVRSALSLPDPGQQPCASHAGLVLLGNSPAMMQVRETIPKLARSQAPVHITGESGSGKELAARLIHEQGSRAGKPFVAVNCGAIPENLMESEFFGYRKGAFTGAEQDREGFFQAASGGTLFLDEVADLPLPMQVKLLRAIQEKKVRKVGATQEEDVDVRLISATHQNLSQMVESGRFRQDLFYRLNVIELRMPALRHLAQDIPAIAQSLLEKLGRQNGVTPRLDKAAVKALQGYAFPGNVRELENILERALAMSSGQVISAEDLHLPAETMTRCAEQSAEGQALPDYLESVEKQMIMEALQKTRFNKTAAAKLLGISFRALRYRLERLGIE